MGKLDEANRAYRQASFVFPNYPHAVIGQGKVKVARGALDFGGGADGWYDAQSHSEQKTGQTLST